MNAIARILVRWIYYRFLNNVRMETNKLEGLETIEVRFDPGIEGARAFVRFVRRYIYSLICGLGHTLRATGIFTWPDRVSGASRKSPVFAPCVPRHGGRNERIFMRALNERRMYLRVASWPAPRSVYRSLERSPTFHRRLSN